MCLGVMKLYYKNASWKAKSTQRLNHAEGTPYGHISHEKLHSHAQLAKRLIHLYSQSLASVTPMDQLTKLMMARGTNK